MSTPLFSRHFKMPERGRHHQRSDVYAEHYSRDQNYSPNGDHSSYDSRSCNQKPRPIDRGGSAGDRRPKQNTERNMTKTPHQGPPAYRDYNHEGSSRLSREMSAHRSETEYYGQPHRQALYNLRYIITGRGLCQLMELSVNLLLIICAAVPYSNSATYRDVASLGGLYYYYYGGVMPSLELKQRHWTSSSISSNCCPMSTLWPVVGL
ncbi:hypothetical protein Q8A73_002404 [Channa argus]|nr:hypothetical protein Q8A73_002404 [Channa argus]